MLATALEPGHAAAAALIINEATELDDAGLQVFLELFAERVRESGRPVTEAELLRFLRAASRVRRPRRKAAGRVLGD